MYGQRKFKEAAEAYQQGLEGVLDDETSVALRSNLAITLIKLKQFERAEYECTVILQSHPPNTKGKNENDYYSESTTVAYLLICLVLFSHNVLVNTCTQSCIAALWPEKGKAAVYMIDKD